MHLWKQIPMLSVQVHTYCVPDREVESRVTDGRFGAKRLHVIETAKTFGMKTREKWKAVEVIDREDSGSFLAPIHPAARPGSEDTRCAVSPSSVMNTGTLQQSAHVPSLLLTSI